MTHGGNHRIFWAAQGLWVYPAGGTPSVSNFMRNVQAIGVDYGADATSIFDLGRSQNFGEVYSKPEVSITISRHLDLQRTSETNFAPFYRPASVTSYSNSYILKNGNIGACGWDGTSILKEWDMQLVYQSDDDDDAYQSQAADERDCTSAYQPIDGLFTYKFKRCLLTNISYNFPIDGEATESLTFSTRNIIKESSNGQIPNIQPCPSTLMRREHLDGNNGKFILPTEVESAIKTTETEGAVDRYVRLIQNIDISCEIDYGEMTDIGKWRGSDQGTDPTEQNKWRYVNTPIETTCSITAVARKNIQQHMLIKDTNFMDEFSVPDRQIRLIAARDTVANQGLAAGSNNSERMVIWDLGEKNILTGISTSGGDAGGGNAELTFEYVNRNNDFVVYVDSSVYEYTPVKL